MLEQDKRRRGGGGVGDKQTETATRTNTAAARPVIPKQNCTHNHQQQKTRPPKDTTTKVEKDESLLTQSSLKDGTIDTNVSSYRHFNVLQTRPSNPHRDLLTPASKIDRKSDLRGSGVVEGGGVLVMTCVVVGAAVVVGRHVPGHPMHGCAPREIESA